MPADICNQPDKIFATCAACRRCGANILERSSNTLKPYVYCIFLLWYQPASAHGGIGYGAGLVEMGYYLGLAAVSLFLVIAIAIRRKRRFTNWLMMALVAPTILFSIVSLFFSSVALYFATIRDFRIGVIFGVVGLVQLFIVQRLYASCKKYHRSET